MNNSINKELLTCSPERKEKLEEIKIELNDKFNKEINNFKDTLYEQKKTTK